MVKIFKIKDIFKCDSANKEMPVIIGKIKGNIHPITSEKVIILTNCALIVLNNNTIKRIMGRMMFIILNIFFIITPIIVDIYWKVLNTNKY